MAEEDETHLRVAIVHTDEDELKLRKEIVAVIKVSGEEIEVGVCKDSDDPTLWIRVDPESNFEPTYMSPPEGRALVSALQMAVCEITGKDIYGH